MDTVAEFSRRRFLTQASYLGAFYAIAGSISWKGLGASLSDDPRISATPIMDAGFASVQKIGEGAYATISDTSKGLTTWRLRGWQGCRLAGRGVCYRQWRCVSNAVIAQGEPSTGGRRTRYPPPFRPFLRKFVLWSEWDSVVGTCGRWRADYRELSSDAVSGGVDDFGAAR